LFLLHSTGFLLDPGSRHKDSDDILSPRHQPRSSSTPCASPVELKGLWLKRDSVEGEQQSMRCGFYWHRNYLLPKQKNIASNLLSQHDRVLSELTRLCSGEDDRLGEIFEGLLNPKSLPPPPL
jgi:hypothetical protein